jgi:hypothetical protein
VSCRLRSPLHGARFCDHAPHGLSTCAALLRLYLTISPPSPSSSLAHNCTDMKRYTKPAGEHVDSSSATLPSSCAHSLLFYFGSRKRGKVGEIGQIANPFFSWFGKCNARHAGLGCTFHLAFF